MTGTNEQGTNEWERSRGRNDWSPARACFLQLKKAFFFSIRNIYFQTNTNHLQFLFYNLNPLLICLKIRMIFR